MTDSTSPYEHERKFLPAGAQRWTALSGYMDTRLISQSYLPGTNLRVRAVTLTPGEHSSNNHTAHWIILKRPAPEIGPHSSLDLGARISAEDYARWSAQCPPPIRKLRHRVAHGDLTWEVDVFLNLRLRPGPSLPYPLTLLEVETPAPTTQVTLPPWAGMEVTGDAAYSNANLLSLVDPLL